ncbi:hypothetical protein [Shewanella algae]|uniref:hypothetical protein n=1 Tax=Shewanella algae TaxID=38313 RepID=UPI0031F4BBEF
MEYEKVQKGNPHKLTIKQHMFPAKSINRFGDENSFVEVFLINDKKEFKLKEDAKLFCARRAWDQRAEAIFMKNIEDKYQGLAEIILNNGLIKLGVKEQAIITDMFALWNIRWHWNKQQVSDQKIEGAISVAREYSVDEQEELEANGITSIRPDLTIPGRSITGVSIQQNLYQVREQMRDAHWGILQSKAGNFIVPDNTPTSRMLPLSPRICLFSQSENERISEGELAELNQVLLDGAEQYFFAKKLADCPLLRKYNK